MSISARNIWIPPVPALSDVGTYNAEGPANGGAFCIWRPGSRRGPAKKQGRQSPDYRPLCFPTMRLDRPLFQFRSVTHKAHAILGAIGLSAENVPT